MLSLCGCKGIVCCGKGVRNGGKNMRKIILQIVLGISLIVGCVITWKSMEKKHALAAEVEKDFAPVLKEFPIWPKANLGTETNTELPLVSDKGASYFMASMSNKSPAIVPESVVIEAQRAQKEAQTNQGK